MPGRFPEGTISRIDSVRFEGETRTEFLKTAVEREIRHREGDTSSGETFHAPDEP
jgi:hypothetical protein